MCQVFLPKKIPGIKNFNPKRSFDHPRHLKSGVPTPLPPNLNHQSPPARGCACLELTEPLSENSVGT